MELARLYPKWILGVFRTPLEVPQSGCPIELVTTLGGSLLHRGYLADLWGVHLPSRGVHLYWRLWGYTRGTPYTVAALTGPAGVTTLTGVFPSAGWFERETWEMLGVSFRGHPDLRRLLTDYGFRGYPLRKDFPVGGYTEVRFSERSKRVISRGVRFTQEFRRFDFQSPWQS